MADTATRLNYRDIAILKLYAARVDNNEIANRLRLPRTLVNNIIVEVAEINRNTAARLVREHEEHDRPQKPVDAIHQPARATPPASRARLQSIVGNGALTVREREILQLAADGKTNPAIANALHIGGSTVAVHLRSVYAKLAVDGRIAAVQTALKLGLVTDNHVGNQSANTDFGRPLTPSELAMLKLAIDGYTISEMSAHARVAVSTVKKHMQRVYTKLGVVNRAQAVVAAARLDITGSAGAQ